MLNVKRSPLKIRLKKLDRLVRSFFLLTLFFVSNCSRFLKDRAREPTKFSVSIPLAEEYSLISGTLVNLIKLKLPRAEVKIVDALSDEYSFGSIEDWLAQANESGILRLYLQIAKLDDRSHIVSFLKANEAKLPFKVSLPSLDVDASVTRGENLFCRMKIESKDLFERQLCTELLQALCGKELRPQTAAKSNFSPKCALIPSLGTKTKPEERVRDLFLTGFPLPLKIKNEYPLNRISEIKENLLISLFRE
jgi:hypothetical protein